MHSLWTPVTPKQVISGAPLMETRSTAYGDLDERALPSVLVAVSLAECCTDLRGIAAAKVRPP